jgi:hypothetical protein
LSGHDGCVPRFRGANLLVRLRPQLDPIRKGVARRLERRSGNLEAGQILLIGKGLIQCHEHVEPGVRSTKAFPS